MLHLPTKRFEHPGGVYHLDYPAHWDQITKDDGQACGFGPHDRDNVGLWVSIMPMSVDSTRLVQELPEVMKMALPKMEAGEAERDTAIHDYALRAEIRKENERGYYWIVAGGDVLLFASTQVPSGERETWNPLFADVMASLRITRDEELFRRQLANDVLVALRERHPEEDFQHDDKGIRGKHQMVMLSNLHREARAHPKRRTELIRHFVDSLAKTADLPMGEETWEDARGCIIPLLKPRDYVDPQGTTRNVLNVEWLADVVICYAIRSKNLFRFVTAWDLNRWGVEQPALHQFAIQNVAYLPWPRELEGSRQPDGGRVILVMSNDSLAATRLLHPDLHHLFSGPLGNPFWAGIPDRGTLVLFSDRKNLRKRIERRLKADCRSAAYPITARPFLVTKDGIAAPRKEKD